MNRLPVSKALRALLEQGTGKPCGFGTFPTVPGATPAAPRVTAPYPYTILYPIGGAEWSGPPLLDDHADVAFVWQVTSVAGQPDQAEWMADRARRVLIGRHADGTFVHELVVPGLSVVHRSIEDDGGSDTGDRAVTSYVERYRIALTPTTGEPA